MVSLRNRARHLQTSLCQWALYDDSVSREVKNELLARFTPGEETAFESDLELTKARLRPVSAQIRTLSRWYEFVLEQINEQLDRARTVLEQGRNGEALTILNDVEMRMIVPNEETLGYFFRTLGQHTSHELHQKLATIDTIIRDLYLPSIKLGQQRGLVSKESLSRSPLAYVTDVPEMANSWRQHAGHAQNVGRCLPVSLIAVPRQFMAQPWNLVAIAHEVGLCVYGDMDLAWEIASKLQTESTNCGVSTGNAPIWSRWHATLFADVFGVMKLGPAYVSGMIELLGCDVTSALTVQTGSPVPPAYLRWHVMLQTLQLLNIVEPARELLNQVHSLCGDANQLAARFGSAWLQLVHESRAVSGLIALSPCQKLGGARVVDIAQPFGQTEFHTALKVKDLLLSGDESCSSDSHFSWAEPLHSMPVTPTVALTALRMAFDATADFETSRRMWVRFWCLQQYLMSHTEQVREREDREFAPGDAVLKQIAMHAIPSVRRSNVPMIPGIAGMPSAVPGVPAMPINMAAMMS